MRNLFTVHVTELRMDKYPTQTLAHHIVDYALGGQKASVMKSNERYIGVFLTPWGDVIVRSTQKQREQAGVDYWARYILTKSGTLIELQ